MACCKASHRGGGHKVGELDAGNGSFRGGSLLTGGGTVPSQLPTCSNTGKVCIGASGLGLPCNPTCTPWVLPCFPSERIFILDIPSLRLISCLARLPINGPFRSDIDTGFPYIPWCPPIMPCCIAICCCCCIV